MVLKKNHIIVQDDPKLPGDGGKVPKPNGVDHGGNKVITLCEISLFS